MRETLHVDRERAVRARPRRRDDSLGDLLLNEIHRADRARRLERMKEDRGRDVVRHVPGEQKFLPGNLAEIHLEYIALDDLDIPRCAVAVAKIRREIAIELDGDDPFRACAQQIGEGAPPGADLHDCVVLVRRQRVGDTFEGGAVDEKVLAEAFARVRKVDAHLVLDARSPPSRTRIGRRLSYER